MPSVRLTAIGALMVIGLTAPAVCSATSTPDLIDASDTGTYNFDNITNDSSPTFNILCTEGQTITLYRNGVSTTMSGICDNSGSISLTDITGPSDNTYDYTAYDESFQSAPLSVTIDTAVTNPGQGDLESASDSGASDTDNITNITTLTFHFACETGASVELYLSGSPTGNTTTCSGGDASITAAFVADTYQIRAIQTDIVGNVSALSEALFLTVDTSPPNYPNTPPDLVSGSDSGSSDTDNLTNLTSLSFSASCNIGEYVTLVRDGISLSETNTWCGNSPITLTDTSAATAAYAITYTDVAGNTTAASSGLNVSIDTSPPTSPSAPDLQFGSDTGDSSSDNITNDTTPTFDLSCETDATVTLKINGVTDVSGTCMAGFVSLTANTLGDGTYTITATQTDLAGNGPSSDSSSTTVTIDTIGPDAPGTPDLSAGDDTGIYNDDNITGDSTLNFSISCTTGFTVTLLSNGLTATTGTCADGTVSLGYTNGSPGTYSMTAKQTDVAGNDSSSSFTLSLELNFTTYSPPGTPDLSSGDDTGNLDSDNITSANTLNFSTSCADNGVIVWLLRDGSIITSGTCSGGSVTISDSAASEGSHDYSAKQGNTANISDVSGTLSVTIDRTASSAPGVPDLAGGSDSGLSSTDNITSATSPVFSISCNDGELVSLIINDGQSVPTGTCSSSTVSLSPTAPLLDGIYTVASRQRDVAGNISGDSANLIVTIDTSNPSAPGAPDLAAASDTGNDATDNVTGDDTPTFTISCETDATVTLYDDVTAVGSGTCTSGSVSVTASSLSNGTHTMTARQADPAGNESTLSTSLDVTIDATVPSTPGTPDLIAASDSGSSNTDNITKTTAVTITVGSCTNGLVVELLSGATVLGTQTCAGSSVSLSISLSTPQVYSLRARQVSTLDVVSSNSSALLVTIDTTAAAPGTPDLASASDTGASATDNVTDAQSLTITATCETNASVTLSQDDVDIATETCVLGTATFTVDVSALANGNYVFAAVQTDVAGNTSTASSDLTVTLGLPPVSSSSSSASSSGGGEERISGGGRRISPSSRSSSAHASASSSSSDSSSSTKKLSVSAAARLAKRLKAGRQRDVAPAHPAAPQPPSLPVPFAPAPESSPSTIPPGPDTYVVNTYALKLRAIPKIPCIILGLLEEGETVTVLGKDAWWAYVRTSSGKEGYVRVEFLKATVQ